ASQGKSRDSGFYMGIALSVVLGIIIIIGAVVAIYFKVRKKKPDRNPDRTDGSVYEEYEPAYPNHENYIDPVAYVNASIPRSSTNKSDPQSNYPPVDNQQQVIEPENTHYYNSNLSDCSYKSTNNENTIQLQDVAVQDPGK
ncbi:uncharacterized protein LOC142357516, partial [Convolutriloba macropyga]|uniref:uncharacterized protein LOC142357516 n=1 Tax=Convolutriloba macropyga TaxID=536237 RepID=UPI003F521C25